MPILIRRLLQLAVVFVVVTFFTVALMSLIPGSPETVVIPFDATGGELRAQFRADNHLDRPLVVQWAHWAKDFLGGDLGNYYTSTGTDPVSTRVARAAPVTVLLILYTQLLSLAVAIPLAVIAARRSGGKADRAMGFLAYGAISLPNFALALILTYLLGVQFSIVPTRGYTGFWDSPFEHFRSMAVPVISLSVGQIAVYMRLLRSDLVATLQEDFILMAKAKGISDRRVLWRHALRPSSITLLTVAGLNVGTLIGGSVVIEFLLGIPGLGLELGNAIFARQYVALQSLVAIIAISFVLVNFLVDWLYTVIDPRIRERKS